MLNSTKVQVQYLEGQGGLARILISRESRVKIPRIPTVNLLTDFP